ncbi:MAG TPA: DUF6259 domain-containing protein [Gemmatimonadaceae bacterium]|nr:DUF6259 domain-containing protein [Gemmatimonadaceae bacterium]
MPDSFSRRDWLKTLGAAGVGGAMIPALSLDAVASTPLPSARQPITQYAPGDIVELYSTSDVFIPPRGRSFMKFSFDFPEPAVVFGDHRFSFLVFTDENTYALDRTRMTARGDANALELTCDGFTWAGGQGHASGTLTARFTKTGDTIEWHVSAEMQHPIKTVTTVIRDVPRGLVSLGGGQLTDTRDGDILGGYTFGAGDLHNFGVTSMTTPIAIVQKNDGDFLYFTTLDTRMRPKRYYFQAGEHAFRVEAIYEHDAWRNDHRVDVPGWRLGHATTFEGAMQPHMTHVEQAFALPSWDTRPDVPDWMRNLALVTTLHGMHYTGFIFNDYAHQVEILRWMATQIPANRVLVFLSSWDGRYYWDYPNYTVPARMGGERGFHTLISEARKLGFRMMPMFGTNAANRKQPVWPKIEAGATYKIDGDLYNLNWVDWNNDRHQDGWLTYMNLGADAWRNWLEGRISDVIDRYGVDAYFLDIVGGHVNSTTGDMHEGTKRLVTDLRAKYPKVACVGEMPYDALYEFIPMYHAGGGARWQKYARFFSHLSAPAPGRGSSGVHESGFGRFNTETLGLSPNAIPTLQVVDDTFTKYRDTMAAIISRAKARAGI